MSPRSHTCLLVGNIAALELRPVEASLTARFGESNLRRVDWLSAAGRADLSADLIVVCQSWSDEYTAGQVAALLSSAPLARLLCVCGPWCDSDGRTRNVWPLAMRVPVSEFDRRLQQEIDVLNGAEMPLPLTASRTEIFAARCRSANRQRAAPAVLPRPPVR